MDDACLFLFGNNCGVMRLSLEDARALHARLGDVLRVADSERRESDLQERVRQAGEAETKL